MPWNRRSHKFSTGKRESIDGIKFASKKEARRYLDLKLLEKAGEITHLNVQPRYPIIHNGIKICTVVLDFSFMDKQRGLIVEDVKSERLDKHGKVAFTTDTRISKIGRNLVEAFYGIKVQLIK